MCYFSINNIILGATAFLYMYTHVHKIWRTSDSLQRFLGMQHVTRRSAQLQRAMAARYRLLPAAAQRTTEPPETHY